MKENIRNNREIAYNLNYILTNLKRATHESNTLKDKIYLELSKDQIIIYLNYVYDCILKWKDNYELIIQDYKEIESIIGWLELCLVDYDDKFHIEGIAYSIYEIGKIYSIQKINYIR